MEVLRVRNVNHALPLGLTLLYDSGIARKSRAGNVIEYPEPVATVYSRPRDRVLFSYERNANPFFHFMEGLWMVKRFKVLTDIDGETILALTNY